MRSIRLAIVKHDAYETIQEKGLGEQPVWYNILSPIQEKYEDCHHRTKNDDSCVDPTFCAQ